MRFERVEPPRELAMRASLIAKIGMLPMEPASLVMERKMLRGIKQRAERLAADATQQTHVHSHDLADQSGRARSTVERSAREVRDVLPGAVGQERRQIAAGDLALLVRPDGGDAARLEPDRAIRIAGQEEATEHRVERHGLDVGARE